MERRRKPMNEVQEDTSKEEAINIVNEIDKEEHSADEERNNQVVIKQNNNTARNRDNGRRRSNLGSKGSTACAACRQAKKKCELKCITAPYFPHNNKEDYKSVMNIFGLANIEKILNGLQTHEDRLEATESLKWEAKCWSQGDRIGPYDEYKKVRNENEKLRYENDKLHESLQLSMSQNNVNYRKNLGVDVLNNRNVNYSSVNTGFGGAGGDGSHILSLMNNSGNGNNTTPIMQPQQETDVGRYSNSHYSLDPGRIPAAGSGNDGSHTLMNDFGYGQLNSQNGSHYRANPTMPRQETNVHRNLQCQNSYHPYQSTRVGIRASGSGYDGSGALMTLTMQPQHGGNEETDELLITELSNPTQSSQYPNSHPQ